MSRKSLKYDFRSDQPPIYMWNVSKEDGEIEKSIIKDYAYRPHSFESSRSYYVYEDKGGNLRFVKIGKLDEFDSGHVYSFTDDDEKAYEAITNGLEKRINESYKKLETLIDYYSKFLSANNKGGIK